MLMGFLKMKQNDNQAEIYKFSVLEHIAGNVGKVFSIFDMNQCDVQMYNGLWQITYDIGSYIGTVFVLGNYYTKHRFGHINVNECHAIKDIKYNEFPYKVKRLINQCANEEPVMCQEPTNRWAALRLANDSKVLSIDEFKAMIKFYSMDTLKPIIQPEMIHEHLAEFNDACVNSLSYSEIRNVEKEYNINIIDANIELIKVIQPTLLLLHPDIETFMSTDDGYCHTLLNHFKCHKNEHSVLIGNFENTVDYDMLSWDNFRSSSVLRKICKNNKNILNYIYNNESTSSYYLKVIYHSDLDFTQYLMKHKLYSPEVLNECIEKYMNTSDEKYIKYISNFSSVLKYNISVHSRCITDVIERLDQYPNGVSNIKKLIVSFPFEYSGLLQFAVYNHLMKS